MTQTASANGWNAINLPEDDLPKTYTYVTVGSNTFISTISCTYWGRPTSASGPTVQTDGVVYRKTFTNNGSQITNDPQWIPQA